MLAHNRGHRADVPEKNPVATEAFKENLLDKLRVLGLPRGRAVRVWIMDEMRYGLHSFSRRVWITGKERPVCPSQQRFQWGYLYGAVGISHARSDPSAMHVIVQDGAGFHLRDGDY